MLVRSGEHTDLAAPAKAEPADDVVWRDYYTRLPQIRLTGDAAQAAIATEVMLDGNDVAKLVECAVRHPNPGMRYAVLAAIWNDPQTFRAIFEFGLKAPPAFSEIRKIVAEALARAGTAPEAPRAGGDKALLPRMPLPAHVKDRRRGQ